jgi:hypothetical protein
MELDTLHRPLGRDLTNAAGQYRLMLLAGASTIRVVRIGFRPQQLPVPPHVNGTFDHDFTLEPLPSLLEAVTVQEARQCPARGDRDRALGLWQQARAGLLASVAARETRSGEMQTFSYERFYSGDSAKLAWQQVQRRSQRTSRPFLPVWPAANFAANGYEVDGPSGTALAAPDADVLLDDSFAATHCFSIATADSAHPDQVGLAFEPAPGRDRLVDVRGTLWIDRVHPAIRTIEFTYTGLSPAEMSGGSGGALSFRSDSNGVVFIDHWRILSALATSGGATKRAFRIVGPSDISARVTGGRVIAARWDDGTQWVARTASVAGRVIGRDGMESAGVFVWLAGTGDTTVTDATGGFHFDTLLPGRYQVDAATGPLAVVGVAQNVGRDSVVASVAGPSDVIVHLDSAAHAARRVCGDRETLCPGPSCSCA